MATDDLDTNGEPKSKRWLALLLVLALAIADAVYLIYEHIHLAVTGESSGGVCDINSTFNCGATLSSSWSSLAGIALPVYVLAFMLGAVALALRAGPRRARPGSADLLLILLSGGLVFSLFLLGIMVFTLDALCPMCLALDGAQLVAVGLVWSMTPGGLAGAVKRVAGSLSEVIVGGDGLTFAGVFAVAFLAGSFAYSAFVSGASEDPARFAENPYASVQGYPQRFDIWEDSAPTDGSPDAPIVIVEYSDFQCPFCARLRHSLEQVRDAFPGQVTLQFRHYPLDSSCNPRIEVAMHPAACEAARASLCAQAQDQFWPLHDLFFDNQRHLDSASIRELASRLDLDMGAFETCLGDAVIEARIENDIEAGVRVHREAGLDGVGTPFFTINGLLLRGNRPLPEIFAIVRAELEGGGGSRGGEAQQGAGGGTTP